MGKPGAQESERHYRVRSGTLPAWRKTVDVYVRKEGGSPHVVGIEREE